MCRPMSRLLKVTFVVSVVVGGSDSSFVGRCFERLEQRRGAVSLSAGALQSSDKDRDDPLQRTRRRLTQLQQVDTTPASSEEVLYRELLQRPANELKAELSSLRLDSSGRKPDLARRLLAHRLLPALDDQPTAPLDGVPATALHGDTQRLVDDATTAFTSFATLSPLSRAASAALATANFTSPTPIQLTAIPRIAQDESLILHAETGSGKTLAYLLPITERLWRDPQSRTHRVAATQRQQQVDMALIVTPTRELAAQVAGVATVLAPPGTVRLIASPCNILSGRIHHAEEPHGGRRIQHHTPDRVRIVVGSARAICKSLFPTSYQRHEAGVAPTSKPEAQWFLSNVRWLVLDEVDRLLQVTKSRSDKRSKRHEKSAAILASVIARLTLGNAQTIAVSATVGRTLRRELSRVLGLSAKECPSVVRGINDSEHELAQSQQQSGVHVGRAVKIPSSVQHYVLPADGSTSGSLLTCAAFALQGLPPKQQQNSSSSSARRTLLVLSKGCELTVSNTLGALSHFNCKPEPQSLLDVLEADGTDMLMEVHRTVSGASGLGEKTLENNNDSKERLVIPTATERKGYILVTGEDSVRGLHLDELDTVMIVGRPKGPDEYVHIAGRTGRAGRKGNVITVVPREQTMALTSWEKMLDIQFIPIRSHHDLPGIDE